MAAVVQALASRGELTRAQLADELRERGVQTTEQMLMILLAYVELDGLICSGRPVDVSAEPLAAIGRTRGVGP